MARIIVALMAIAATCAAGCGSASAGRSATPTTQPPCRQPQLTVTVGRISPETGEHGFSLNIANVGTATCALDGYPTVRLLDATGAPLPTTYQQGGHYTTTRPPREVPIKPGGHAIALVAKYRCDTGSRDSATAAEITLPGMKEPTTLDVVQLAYCGPDDPGDTVYVSPIEPDYAAAVGRG